MNHILLDEFKNYKGILQNNVVEDSQLNLVLFGVTDYLLNQYGIFLEKVDLVDEIYIDTQKNKIFLNKDIQQINKLYENDVEQDLANYKYYNGILYKNNGNYPKNGVVRIEYTLGYDDVDSIPSGIKLAIFIFVDRIYEKIENNANLVSSFSDPIAGREVFRKNIPKEIYMLLAPYYYINI